MLIAAQARAPVDCPTLQAIGPQATNQAVKAIAIARTFLKESQSIDSAPACGPRLTLPILCVPRRVRMPASTRCSHPCFLRRSKHPNTHFPPCVALRR